MSLLPSRKNTIHICAILAVMLIPMMFVRPDERLTLTLYLFKSVMSVAMIAVFYINYLWLVPRMIEKGNRERFVVINVALIIFMAIIIMIFRHYEIHYMTTELSWKPPHNTEITISFRTLMMLRDAFNLLLSSLLALSLRMTQHAQRQIQLSQEAEVAKREAELRGLRFQLSPHFLLNSLNNIYALTAISTEKAQEAIIQLSQLLRHMLYDSQEQMVSLKQECDFIQSYIELMRLRLPANVKVKINISIPPDDTTTVAPLLFISLVENAFKHGVSATEPSFIHISVTSTDNDSGEYPDREGRIVRCHVANSNFPKTDADRSGHGIGLVQVQQRLNATYQGHYRWTYGVDKTDGMYHSEITIW